MERRFAWFRRVLRAYEGRYQRVFPPHWRVAHTLAVAFAEATRNHLLTVLGACRAHARCLPPSLLHHSPTTPTDHHAPLTAPTPTARFPPPTAPQATSTRRTART